MMRTFTKKKPTFLLLMLVCLALTVSAQTTVTVGTGTSTSFYSPIYISSATSAYAYSNNIMLFTPAEIGMAGNLIELAWEKANTDGYIPANAEVTIYVKETTATSVPTSSGTFAAEVATATMVYSSTSVTLPTSASWVNFSLTSPFAYSGSSNLMVLVDWYRPGSPTGQVTWYYTNTPGMAATWASSTSPPTYSYGSGYTRPNTQMTFAPSQANDAGVAQIAAPVSPVAPGNNNVEIHLRNYGTATLTSATIGWAINGIAQTPYSWTGSLASASVDSNVTLGSFNFPLGTHEITAWTSLPNGNVDSAAFNDTASASVICAVSLNGTYTIGGTGADYATIAAALADLNAAGVSGPVTFNIAAGTYTEQMTLGTILGISATNNVTFQSATGNASDVTIENNASGSSDNWTVLFDDADYVTLQNLTLVADDSTYARVVVMDGNSEYNTIDNCVIISQPEARNGSNAAGIYGSSSGNNYNAYTNNEIWNGYYGIYLYGSSSSLEEGTIIEDNVIQDFYYYGIYIAYHNAPKVNRNAAQNHSSSGYIYGIYLRYCDNALEATKNDIHIEGSSTHYGLRIYYCEATDSTKGLVANNEISITGTSTSTNYGLYVYYSDYQMCYHNSVNMAAGGTSSRAAYYYQGGDHYSMNNIFVNTAGGYAMYVSGSPLFLTNYNNYYATGSNLAYWSGAQADLAALQAASLQDANSVSLDPVYTANDLLYPGSVGMDDLGTPVAEVPDDIIGTIRSTTSPDMGCYEYTPPQDDAGIVSIDQPSTVLGPGSAPIAATFQNYGLAPLTTVNLNFSVDGGPVTTYLWVGNLAPTATAGPTTIGNHTFGYGTHEVKVWTSDPNLSLDGNHLNDTMTLMVTVCDILSGTFTIGDTNSGADYGSINDAINAMTYCGIGGNIIFNINSGVYNEQVTLPEIPGASLTNSVTFQSTTGNASDVIIKYAPSSSSDNWVWKFDGADYITVQNVTMKVDTPYSSYSRVVVFDNMANYNVVQGNVLEGQDVSSSSYNYAVIYNENSIDEFNIISGNDIMYGSYGIRMYTPSSSSQELGNIIDGNTISGFYYYGIYCYAQEGAIVSGNTLSNSPNSSTVYGIYMYYSDGPIQVTNNRLELTGSGTNYGIRIYYCDATAGSEGLTANNFIAQTATSSGTVYGLYIYNSTNQYLYHNSINVESTSSSARGFYISGSSASGIDMVNNIFAMPGGGTPFYLGSSSYLSALNWMDYNVAYTTGSQVGYASGSYATLADWSAFSGTDTNSVEADPAYSTPALLYPTSASVNGIAIPLSLVATDIDGNPRSLTAPDPGAAEFDPPSNDMAILSWDYPTASACGLSSTEYVTISLYNNGLTAQTGTQVTYSIDGGTTWATQELIANPIPAGDTLVYTFSAPADMSTLGDYHCLAAVDAPGDVNVLNDTVSGITVTHIGTISSFPFMEDFSSGSTAYFGLNGNSQSTIEVNSYQGNNTPALFFTGGSSTGWSGFSTGTSPTQAWVDNVTHHASAVTCNVDATGLTGLKLAFDLKMEYSYGWGYSWFRVLINDTIQLTDLNGITNFNPATATTDPFTTVEFDLTPYVGGPLEVTLQSSMKYAYGTGTNNGDNAYVDNVQFYEPSPHDVGVGSFVYPAGSACANSSTNVVVELKNYGGIVQDSVPVTVEVMNPDSTYQTISGVFTDSLFTNITSSFNVGTINATMSGTYHMTAWTELPNDANLMNDTMTGMFTTITTVVDTFPVTEDFETFITGSPGTFMNGWTNDPTSGFRFQVNSGGTGSSNTGPEIDHTLGTASGIYVYTEASSGSQGDEAYLISPCLNMSMMSAPELRFWYHMTGSDIGTLAVDVLYMGVWTEIFTLVGPQQAAIASPWEEAVIPLGMYQSADKIRFRVIRGPSYEGDVSLDDITIQEAPQFEAELLEAYGLMSGCDLTSDDLMIKIVNKGGQTINGGLTASYQIHGAAAAVTETITDTIGMLDTLVYTFATPINLIVPSDSMFHITAWVDLSGDPDPSNDTAMTSVNSLVSPMDPSVTNVSVTPGSPATLTVNNPDPNQVYFWYDSLYAMNALDYGDTFITPPLTNTTVYWVEAQWGAAASYLALGPGTGSNNYVPAYGWYDYSWTKTIYTADELNFFGQVDTISFFVDNLPSPNPYVMPNQRIWLGHTSDMEFSDLNFADTTNMTKVYDGTVSWSGPGEVAIPLDQPFVYNGSDNLVVYYENWDGDYASGEPEFVATDITLNQCVYEYQDNTFPYANAGAIASNKPDMGFFGSMIAGGNGCPSNRVPDTAFVTAPTVVADAGLDTSICLGDSAHLMVTATGGNPPYMYAWSPAASLNDPNIADPMAGPMTTTTYSVTVTDQNGDSGTDDVIVLVNPGPNVNLTLPVDSIYDNDPPLTLTGGTPAGGTYSGQGVSGGQFDPSGLTPAQSYTITYTFTDPATGCTGSATDDIFVKHFVGLEELSGPALAVFPNPTSGMVTVTMSSAEDVIDLSLLDVTGKVVFEQRITDAKGKMTRELDLSNLPQGIYYVRLQAGEDTRAVKVVKH